MRDAAKARFKAQEQVNAAVDSAPASVEGAGSTGGALPSKEDVEAAREAEAKLDAATHEVERLRADAEARERDAAELRDKLAAMSSALEQAQTEARSARDAEREAKDDAVAAKAARDAAVAAATGVAGSTADIASAEADLKARQQKHDEAKQRLEEAQRQLEDEEVSTCLSMLQRAAPSQVSPLVVVLACAVLATTRGSPAQGCTHRPRTEGQDGSSEPKEGARGGGAARP